MKDSWATAQGIRTDAASVKQDPRPEADITHERELVRQSLTKQMCGVVNKT
jgi:hypothetical protein